MDQNDTKPSSHSSDSMSHSTFSGSSGSNSEDKKPKKMDKPMKQKNVAKPKKIKPEATESAIETRLVPQEIPHIVINEYVDLPKGEKASEPIISTAEHCCTFDFMLDAQDASAEEPEQQPKQEPKHEPKHEPKEEAKEEPEAELKADEIPGNYSDCSDLV